MIFHRLLERSGEWKVLTTAQTQEDVGRVDEHIAGRVFLLPKGGFVCGDSTHENHCDGLPIGRER
jgi:hypothetical protein